MLEECEFRLAIADVTVKSGTWSDNAVRILEERYLKKDAKGHVIETPDERVWAVAQDIALAELRYREQPGLATQWAVRFYEMMIDHLFLPNSPTLANAGKGNGLQYSACYVLPIYDSMESIFGTLRDAAIIHKSGGGTGFPFSNLRSARSRVSTTGGAASGPISFMRVYDAATESVKQGGMRRGANMGVLACWHPHIREFVHLKRDRVVTNFNISIGATDAFIDAIRSNQYFSLVDPHTKEQELIYAPDLWAEIKESAWLSGDPGFLFLDRANRWSSNPVPHMGPLEATNPCGEAWLYPYEACNLGSINLARFARSNGLISWDKLATTVAWGIRFLDNVIDRNPYPLPQIDRVVKLNRRIGLGVMGWHHLLMQLGVPYDSMEARGLAVQVASFIQREADKASEQLAEERGPFPNWERSIYAQQGRKPLRNCNRTTIAPTGTISLLAGTSSGIEPVFALEYEHRANGRVLQVKDPVWVEYLRTHGQGPDDEWYPGPVFKTAQEIHWRDHIEMQATWQKYTDNAVSKTINMPHNATPEEIGEAYMLAYDKGCLGITVFRDGCLGDQVLNATTESKRESQAAGSEARYQIEEKVRCPECGGFLVYQEGCESCPCGYSRCSVA